MLTAFLAGLPPAECDAISTQAERKAAIALRKNGILAGKVKAALKCTQKELDRWSADGRLPHLFVRVLSFEKATPCRFWDADIVDAAVDRVDAWRLQDQIKKTFKRRGLKAAA